MYLERLFQTIYLKNLSLPTLSGALHKATRRRREAFTPGCQDSATPGAPGCLRRECVRGAYRIFAEKKVEGRLRLALLRISSGSSRNLRQRRVGAQENCLGVQRGRRRVLQNLHGDCPKLL